MNQHDDPRRIHSCPCPACRLHPRSRTAQLHRALNRLLASTDERSRRLFLGLLALRHGRGGIALFAQITGKSPHTIRAGIREIHQPRFAPSDRIRHKGAGRKPVEVTAPGPSRP